MILMWPLRFIKCPNKLARASLTLIYGHYYFSDMEINLPIVGHELLCHQTGPLPGRNEAGFNLRAVLGFSCSWRVCGRRVINHYNGCSSSLGRSWAGGGGCRWAVCYPESFEIPSCETPGDPLAPHGTSNSMF